MLPAEKLSAGSPAVAGGLHQLAMLPPEKTIDNGYEEVGSVKETITSLHPEAEGIPLGEVISLTLQGLRERGLVVPSIFVPESHFILTGTDAKRILGGTPIGWNEPGRIWNALSVNDPKVASLPIAQSLIRGGRNDTDIRFVMNRGVTMDDISGAVNEPVGNLPCRVTTEMKNHGTSRQLRMTLEGGFNIDLGGLWDYRRHEPHVTQVLDDNRMSPHFPWREFGSQVHITDDGDLTIRDTDRKSFWIAPVLNTGIYRADRAQALNAWLRSKATDYWWPPLHFPRVNSFYAVYTEPDFWENAVDNSVDREDNLNDRYTEIAVNTLLLLTCDPSIGHQMKMDGVLNQLYLGERWDGSGLSPIDDYQDRLRSGQLQTYQAGPALLSKRLGVSLSELIPLCAPRR